MTDLAINGRFLTRPARGVNRVASELILALVRLRDAGDPDAPKRLRVLVPDGVLMDQISDPIAPYIIPAGTGGGNRWEQTTLPRAAGNAVLFNPCNVGPLVRRHQVTLIHDAQVYTTPESYGWGFRLWYRFALPVLARRSAGLATVSQTSHGELEQLGVFPTGKAQVLPNGADHILRTRADPSVLARHGLARHGYAMTIGSLAPHKNIATAIHATKAAGLPLVVAGGAPAAMFQNANLPKSAHVSYLGRVSDGELRALYENATALIFPSLHEGFGLPPLEAMHCGCPVVASDIPTLRDVCSDAALASQPMDVAGFAQHLRDLMDRPALRAQQVRRGHERAALYTWERSARALMELVASL
ncbi:MAG: glycosyltransferase involved in cell wall biosynthesis [Paracoccaceae bacterium]|jgi:glycosyltransferase involved in cell wall biosynthesis